MAPAKGLLTLHRVALNVRQRYGDRAMVATLLDANTVSSSVIRELHWARVVQIKEGGVMIEGTATSQGPQEPARGLTKDLVVRC